MRGRVANTKTGVTSGADAGEWRQMGAHRNAVERRMLYFTSLEVDSEAFLLFLGLAT